MYVKQQQQVNKKKTHTAQEISDTVNKSESSKEVLEQNKIPKENQRKEQKKNNNKTVQN